MKCNDTNSNIIKKKTYNSPVLVELDISKTAAKQANHTEHPVHGPNGGLHQTGRANYQS